MKSVKTSKTLLLALSMTCTLYTMEEEEPNEQHIDDRRQRTVELFRAVEKGQLALVEHLINAGADIHARDDENRMAGPGIHMQPIHIAALAGQQEIVKLLVKYGASINGEDGEGKRLMHYAAWNSDLALATWLIDYEKPARRAMLTYLNPINTNTADIEAKLAVSSNRSAGVIAKDNQGIQPIHMIAMNCAAPKAIEMVKWLIAHGASHNIVDSTGKQPIDYAFLEANWDLVNLFMEQGSTVNINIADPKATQLIHTAAFQGDLRKVQWLIDHCADCNVPNSYGYLPIDYAFLSNNLDVIKLLATHAVTLIDVNVCLPHSYSLSRFPIHRAAERGNIAFVEWLIEHGAMINVKDKAGMRPIHYAASECSIPVVALLVKRGAAVDSQDDQKRTPLHVAAGDYFVKGGENQAPMLEWLIAHGAMVSDDNTLKNLNTDFVDLAVKRIKELLDPLLQALVFNDLSKAKALIFSLHFERTAPLIGRALQIASGRGNREFVRLLVEHYSEHIDRESLQKSLECAATTGQLEIFSELRVHCDRINADFRKTLEECAFYAVAQEHEPIVRYIQEKGDLEQRSLRGLFARSINLGRVDIVHCLYAALDENLNKKAIPQATSQGNANKTQNTLSRFLSTALSVAVARRHDSIVVFLLDRNLDAKSSLNLYQALHKLKTIFKEVPLSEHKKEIYMVLRKLLGNYFIITQVLTPERMSTSRPEEAPLPIELLKYITQFLLHSYLRELEFLRTLKTS